jgi:hypothetical protein
MRISTRDSRERDSVAPMTARLLSLLAVAACSAALTACGGDDPTIDSAEYIKQCNAQISKSQEGVLTDKQVADICKCTQDKLVAQGLGDRKLDDEGLKDEGETVGRDCALQVVSSK